MFFTKDFIEKYLKRAKKIKIDNYSMHKLPYDNILVLAAYLYDMYMISRKYIPDDEIWIDNKFDKCSLITSGDSS